MRKKKDRKGIRLRKKKNRLSEKLHISYVDMLKAICTHRDAEGEKLIMNSDGTVTCQICGKTFIHITEDQETIKQVFDDLVNCLETMKLYLGAGSQNPYIDNSNNNIFENFVDTPRRLYGIGIHCLPTYTAIPMAAKAPALYQIASDRYKKYRPSAFDIYNRMMS